LGYLGTSLLSTEGVCSQKNLTVDRSALSTAILVRAFVTSRLEHLVAQRTFLLEFVFYLVLRTKEGVSHVPVLEKSCHALFYLAIVFFFLLEKGLASGGTGQFDILLSA
jgi:hypothetical protein